MIYHILFILSIFHQNYNSGRKYMSSNFDGLLYLSSLYPLHIQYVYFHIWNTSQTHNQGYRTPCRGRPCLLSVPSFLNSPFLHITLHNCSIGEPTYHTSLSHKMQAFFKLFFQLIYWLSFLIHIYVLCVVFSMSTSFLFFFYLVSFYFYIYNNTS